MSVQPKFQLRAVGNPYGWLFAEYAPGNRVLKDHFPDRSVLTGREDVQINAHGVVLFYNTDTANLLLKYFVMPQKPATDARPLEHRELEPLVNEQTITLQIPDVNSTQEWAADPAMIEVEMSSALLEKVERCVTFMNEHDVDEMVITGAMGYTLYELAEDSDENVITGEDGMTYSEFVPEYTVSSCNAKIFKYGGIVAVMPFKHTTDELWCDVGTINELKLKFPPSSPIRAEVHTDSRSIEVEFDASAWFAQATDQQIVALHQIDWAGDYAADAVAEYFEKTNKDIARIFDFAHFTQRTRNPQGFECSVDKSSAMAWLKERRHGLWARLVCEDNNVSLVEAQEDEVRGMWDWIGENGNACDCSFQTIEAAAIDAVHTLSLDDQARGSVCRPR